MVPEKNIARMVPSFFPDGNYFSLYSDDEISFFAENMKTLRESKIQPYEKQFRMKQDIRSIKKPLLSWTIIRLIRPRQDRIRQTNSD